MRRITVTNNLTLDGVMQAPGAADEDSRGGFAHGGWALPYNDEVKGKEMAAGMSRSADLLFGRRTYEQFHRTWQGRTDNPFSSVLDRTRKYVVSNTLAEPLAWQNSTLVSGNVPDAIAALKREDGNDLVILGSGALVRSLLARRLIDSMVLLIHPLVLGAGQRMFVDDASAATFEVTRSVTSTKGVIIATYELRPTRDE